MLKQSPYDPRIQSISPGGETSDGLPIVIGNMLSRIQDIVVEAKTQQVGTHKSNFHMLPTKSEKSRTTSCAATRIGDSFCFFRTRHSAEAAALGPARPRRSAEAAALGPIVAVGSSLPG